MKETIEAVLEHARPLLAMHGGNVEFVRLDEDTQTVFIRFLGGCVGCPMSQVTLKMGIEVLMMEQLPSIKAVEAVE